jgi:homoserine kinase type II
MVNPMHPGHTPSDSLALVVHTFGIEPTGIAPIAEGRMNRHWRVATAGATFVLRQYNALRSADAIDFEHRLLAHAAGRGWPVAQPLPLAAGPTVLAHEDAYFALFPFLPGEPAPYDSVANKRIKGRLLARLHDDLANFPRDGQRDGFGRAWELDLLVAPAAQGTFNELLARLGREHNDLATAIRTQRYRSLRELSRLGYGDLPEAIAHADFHHDNVLFQDGALSALLDFDNARWDSRAFDIAASLCIECLDLAANHDAIDLRFAEAFLNGYATAHPLDPAEAALLVPLCRAWYLAFVALRLTQWTTATSPKAIASIVRTAERRFPALEAIAPQLATVAHHAG